MNPPELSGLVRSLLFPKYSLSLPYYNSASWPLVPDSWRSSNKCMVLYVTTLGLCIFGLCEQNSSLAFDSITDLDFSLAWLPEAQNKKYSPPVLTGRILMAWLLGINHIMTLFSYLHFHLSQCSSFIHFYPA